MKIPIHLPDGVERRDVFKWLNLQYIGRESMSCNFTCSDNHMKAAYNVCIGRIFEIEFEVNKKGNIKIIGVVNSK